MSQSKTSKSKSFDLQFRAITDADLSFLETLYSTTRAAELSQVPWTQEQKDEFIAMQFNAQHTFYQEHFTKATYEIVSKDGFDIGRLYVDERDDETRIIDIALMPNYQKMGIGRYLLEQEMDKAKERGVPVTIHVEKNNPAMSLYKRLGFELVEDQGVYDLMKWAA
ncbi:MAG: GNAT family N-acetyltransferase [Pseudomonadota bacterium]